MRVVCVLVDVHVVDVVTGVAAKGALPGLARVATEVGPGPRSWARQGVRGGVQRVLQRFKVKTGETVHANKQLCQYCIDVQMTNGFENRSHNLDMTTKALFYCH